MSDTNVHACHVYNSLYRWSSVGCRFINREGVQTRSCDNSNSPTLEPNIAKYQSDYQILTSEIV